MDALTRGLCHATDWSPWSKCKGECGATGTVVRERQVLHRPHHRHLPKGSDCPHETHDEKPCVVRCRDGRKTGDL